MMAWAVKVAAADGNISDSERKVLEGFAANRGIPAEMLEQAIGAALHGQLETREPANTKEAREWLKALAEVAMADGNIDRTEYALLRSLGDPFGISDYDVKMMLRQVRTDHYQAASAALRDAKRNS